ncbi:MAG: Hpt domain-containing protein [Spirochaetales bacterium]|nr:Hpt domain-containing protein [Spirochaetales bacterium]
MKTLHAAFIDDATQYLQKLEEILTHYNSKKDESENINEAFRLIHSVKSESAYLGYESIAEKSHQIESVFEELRRTGDMALNTLTIIDRIRTIRLEIEKIQQEKSSKALAETRKKRNLDLGSVSSSGPKIGEFEKELLAEAQERGERLYRLVCEIDDDAPLKHPKLYLIINNLEQIVNVIAYTPSLKTINNNASQLNVIFSTSVDEKEIYDAVNIDQVKRIQLAGLEYTAFLSTSIVANDAARPGGTLRINSSVIDKILSYLDEMKIRIHGMNKYAKKDTQILPIYRKQLFLIKNLSDEMETILKNIRMVSLKDEFSDLQGFVRELAGQLGKKAELTINTGNIRLDRRIVDQLVDPIRHIIRNAVDHGLETPEKRLDAGKSETGSVDLTVKRDEQKISIEISDDGRGIDREKILKRALELGLIHSIDSDIDILSLLSEPGFSTSEQITEISGRGVGLDLVHQRIKEIAGSGFSYINWPGEGCTFIITLPGEFTVLDVLIVQSAGKTLAVPVRNIERRIETDLSRFSANKDGRLLYENMPVYTAEGRLFESDSLPEEKLCLEIRHLRKKGCLLIDEILFSQQLPEDQLTLIDEGNPHLFSVHLAGRRMEYYYLNPSIIL